MKKIVFISLVSFMIISILGIVVLQGYWIYSAWNDKEKEFSLAVQQSLQIVAEEIQERELSDYISKYERLIDSLDTPDDASFANLFFFIDEDKTNNLFSYYAFGILKEDYNITPYLNPTLGDTISQLTDVKQVKSTTIIKKNDVFDRENNIASSIEKIKTVDRMNISNQRIQSAFKSYTANLPIHKRLNVDELDFDKNINIAKSIAIRSAIKNGIKLDKREMKEIFDSLFKCKAPTVSPDGKNILRTIGESELEQILKNPRD